MNKVRLLFKGVTEIVGSDKLGLILLTDVHEQREVSVVCDHLMVRQFMARLEHVPITEKLLPDVLWQVVKSLSPGSMEILIDNIDQGQYHAMLCSTETFMNWTLRASDAILLSIISGMPLYMEQRLMLRQSVPYKAGAAGISLPINVISDQMLDLAMQKAISDENYELASQLRDEKQRREGEQKGQEL